MKYQMLILPFILILLSSCSCKEKVCVKVERLSKLDKVSFEINNDGGMDKNNTTKAINFIKMLRIIENYYFETIGDSYDK